MKNLILAVMLVLGMGTMATAQEAPVCDPASTLTAFMDAAKEAEFPIIVIQGDGLDKFTKSVEDSIGAPRPEGLIAIVVSADAVQAVLNGDAPKVQVYSFLEGGCMMPGRPGSFSGQTAVKALKAALDLD